MPSSTSDIWQRSICKQNHMGKDVGDKLVQISDKYSDFWCEMWFSELCMLNNGEINIENRCNFAIMCEMTSQQWQELNCDPATWVST